MTLEEIKSYRQFRTPDFEALAACINSAKGENRTMAQFAEDTGIGASTLSRIANMKIQKPLSVDVLISIYENRANREDKCLLDALVRYNGLAAPGYIEKINAQRRSLAEETSRANLMKNAILAGVLTAGIPIKRVIERQAVGGKNPAYTLTRVIVGEPCDFFMELGEAQSTIDTWQVYLYPSWMEDEGEDVIRQPLLTQLDEAVNRIATLFLRDAWQPRTLANVKTTFAFLDERLFNLFCSSMRSAQVNNEMSMLLLDAMNGYKVVDEVWMPGEYNRLVNMCVFKNYVSDENDNVYELENTEDTE